MKLRVNGVLEIELADPEGLCQAAATFKPKKGPVQAATTFPPGSKIIPPQTNPEGSFLSQRSIKDIINAVPGVSHRPSNPKDIPTKVTRRP